MKNCYVLLFLLATTTLFAQSADYKKLLEQRLTEITPTATQEDWLTYSQNFYKISKQHPDNWLTNYYTAYAFMQLAGTYEDQSLPTVVAYLDKAQAAIDKANTLAPNHAEVLVLQGFIYVARIWESPFMNGGLYGRKISKLFKQAIEIDPENPRAYYLKGLLTYHTPRFVGGGKERAKPWLVTAQAQYDDFNYESEILPYWGAKGNEELLATCEGMAVK